MYTITKKEWNQIQKIADDFKLLESPKDLTKKQNEIKLKLLQSYGIEFDIYFELNKEYQIIYQDLNINDYNLIVTKITDSYLYGIGGLIKYKKENILGIII